MTDVLSEILSHLDLRGLRCTRLEAAGVWSWRFPPRPIVKLVAVLKGSAWLVPGGAEPIRLDAGDTFVLAGAADYVVASDPALPPRDGMRDFDWARSDVARHGGDDTVMLGGGFVVDGGTAGLLLDAVPRVIRVRADDPAAPVLHASLRLLDDEIASGRMGATAAARRLAELLLIQAMRAWASRGEPGATGWLRGLGDPRIGSALRLMHGDPGQRWTVAGLARETGMSRSAFAARFAGTVGMPPLAYLTRWRMERARAALRAGDRLARVARVSGYGSESAFGIAFKRHFGEPPGRYRARR